MLSRRQEVVGSRQGVRQRRVVRGVVGRRHLGVHSRRPAHVQPAPGRRVHVPPSVRRSNRVALDAPMVRGTGHGVEGPRLVRVARVDRSQVMGGRRTFHLPQKGRLVVVHVRVVGNCWL